ncbi:hypothetical protein WA026_015962 [Henosepilachna vigintioctopunctata]|uniref:Kinetochore protein Nuf2 N-terminal domain-containing protein n=1 Tax=Henosepilachna vigintioctopunctata TaxID=420089 RepID=A0AAW1U7A9_9CUCU
MSNLNTKGQAHETRKSLINSVKSNWPDLVITDGHLQNPTQSFVYNFYSRFYNEYEKRLSEIKTNILKQEPEQILENYSYIDEISLAIKLRKISKLLNEKMPFVLNDIFEPQPRRTVLFFSVFMNLLIYMKTDPAYLDELREVVNEKEEFEKLYYLKQQVLKEIADENALHFKLENSIEKLKNKIESIRSEYKIVLKQRAEKEYEYHNLLVEKNKLEEYFKMLEGNIESLREQYSVLQEQFVDETKIEAIEKNISALEKEFDELDVNRAAFVSSLENQEEITKFCEKCLALLEHCNFSCNQLNDIQTSVESIFNMNQEVIKLKEDINNKLEDINKLKDKDILLKDNILISETKFSDLKCSKEEYVKELKEKFNLVSADIDQKINEYKVFHHENEGIQSVIKDLEMKKSHLIAGVMKEYGMLVQKFGKIYNCFNNALINIDNQQNLEDED